VGASINCNRAVNLHRFAEMAEVLESAPAIAELEISEESLEDLTSFVLAAPEGVPNDALTTQLNPNLLSSCYEAPQLYNLGLVIDLEFSLSEVSAIARHHARW